MGYIKDSSALPSSMTSNTGSNGKASVSTFADNYLHLAYRAFDKNTGTYWQAQSKSGWAKYEFDSPIIISKYSLRATGTINGAPKKWTFEGSSDDQNWIVLDSRTNITNWTSGLIQDYIFSNTIKYKFYRLNITTTNNDSERIQLSEIDMFELVYYEKFLISSGTDGVSVSQLPESNPMPLMTAGTMNGFTVTESLIHTGTYNGWKAFDGITNVATSCWAAPKVPTKAEPQWIAIQLHKKCPIYKYELTGQYGSPLRSPKDWKFEASNDGVSWIVLDTQSNVNGWSDNAFKSFSTTNQDSYLYYRIIVTANNGDATFICIGEMKIYQPKSYIITYVPNLDDEWFIEYGMNKNDVVDLRSSVKEVSTIVNSPETLGTGRVFKQRIDTTKVPIEKASIT